MPTLEWIGKDRVVNHHQQVPFRILERKYSFDENGRHEEDNGSENMIIHGDNLEALKALLPKYEGRIKCIYIDPPYNTAKSTNKNQQWVYNDNVDDPKMRKWLGEVVGNEGDDLSRHDKWLCMMYPRLKLLQRLLDNHGAIFISIDDNEQASLHLICDEIFGSRNFVKTFIWHTEGHTDNQDPITGVHEYIVCYAKDKDILQINNIVDPNISEDSKILRDFAENSITKNGSKNPPSVIELPVGFPCEIDELFFKKSKNIDLFIEEVSKIGYIDRKLTQKYEMQYPARLENMIVKNGVLQKPCKVYTGWMNAGKLHTFIKNGCVEFTDNSSLLKFYLSKNGVIYYYRSDRTQHYVQSVLQNMGTTEKNKYMIEKMEINFEYPKPYELLSFLFSLTSQPNDIILDSFAGSGTTAHAVLNMNKTDVDGCNRKFILVEKEDYAESITAERVKRVINGYGKDKNAVDGTGGNFSYYDLGDVLLLQDGNLNEEIDEAKIREYIWYMETKEPFEHTERPDIPYYLGLCRNTAYFFYYEKDKVTTLDHDFLSCIKEKADSYIIYADLCTIPEDELKKWSITFKKIPRDIARL